MSARGHCWCGGRRWSTREVSRQNYLESISVVEAMLTLGGGRAAITMTTDFKLGGLVLTQALNQQFENVVFDLCIEHSTNQRYARLTRDAGTFVALSGNLILRVGEVKGDGAVFDEGIAAREKELFEHLHEAFWVHEAIIRKLCSCVCEG